MSNYAQRFTDTPLALNVLSTASLMMDNMGGATSQIRSNVPLGTSSPLPGRSSGCNCSNSKPNLYGFETKSFVVSKAIKSWKALIAQFLPAGAARNVLCEFVKQLITATVDTDSLTELLNLGKGLSHDDARAISKGMSELDRILKPLGVSLGVGVAGGENMEYRLYDVGIAQELEENKFGIVLCVDSCGVVYSKEILVPDFDDPQSFQTNRLTPNESARRLSPTLFAHLPGQ